MHGVIDTLFLFSGRTQINLFFMLLSFFADHNTWMNKLSVHGHQPDDWVEYIEFFENDVTLKYSEPLIVTTY